MVTEKIFLENVLGMQTELYYVARSILWNDWDAADAVQEAMLKGWRMRNRLRDIEHFRPWFMRILVNQCRDMQRKCIRERKIVAEYKEGQIALIKPAGDSDIMDVLQTLPEKLRLPMLLYYFDGYSQKDIADIVGISPEQVKTRIRQARTHIKKLMLEEDDSL